MKPTLSAPLCSFHQSLAKRTNIGLGALALAAFSAVPAVHAQQVGDVFVIAMENHNWTQPNGNVSSTGGIEQIKNNPYAPFINSLVGGSATANINGMQVNISAQTAYTDTYYNALPGTLASIHPSEPNYIWSEAGSNLGVANDNDPYGSGGNNQNTTQHLSGYLNQTGTSWKSYQEDTNISYTTNQPVAAGSFTVPLSSKSGTFPTGATPNAYNGSLQYNYAAKHNPMLYFTDTNGGNNATTTNPQAKNYAPLQQLDSDLKNNKTARYNWITPNQYNDMHTALSGGFTYKGTHLTGDSAQIAQGDNFLSIVVPEIMGSQAYQNNGAIVLWMDETEPATGDTGSQNDFGHTIMEIVISPLAQPNVNGLPFDSTVEMTHSSDVKTFQNLFGVGPGQGYAYLGDAATPGTNGLDSMFLPGAVVPEPGTTAAVACGALALGVAIRRRTASR